VERGYQLGFSEMHSDAMHNREFREKKARTMVAVLDDYFQGGLDSLSLLDIGSSTGIIDNYLAGHFGRVVGIDIDDKAIAFAQENFGADNLEFRLGDAMKLDFPDNTFDVAICAQIYEHVPDAGRMVAELHRVLKPGGVCYFAAGNRMSVWEYHYHLPFLSVIPRPLGHVYVRVMGRAKFYYEKHLSYWGLKKLVKGFRVHDYTRRMVESPQDFHVEYMVKPGSLKYRVGQWIVNYAFWLSPTFIWILEKP
jgi:ubiquinone/menaquinone biosynthesis C-methylase UbiE